MQALLLAKSENPPVKDNERRKVYMELMKELWDQMGTKIWGSQSIIYETKPLDLKNP